MPKLLPKWKVSKQLFSTYDSITIRTSSLGSEEKRKKASFNDSLLTQSFFFYPNSVVKQANVREKSISTRENSSEKWSMTFLKALLVIRQNTSKCWKMRIFSLSLSKKRFSLFIAIQNPVYESLFLNQIGPVSSQISFERVLRRKTKNSRSGARRKFFPEKISCWEFKKKREKI